MKIALAQINTTIGDLSGNREKILAFIERARAQHCRLVVFPEMAVTGYPPGDLVVSESFITEQAQSLEKIAAACTEITAVVGFLDANRTGSGKPLFNSAAVLTGGRLQTSYAKQLLPTYDVFDEGRYFEPGHGSTLVVIDGARFGLTICEDLWAEPGFEEATLYRGRPVEAAVKAGASAIINLSASPFHLQKPAQRQRLVSAAAKRLGIPVAYTNLVGGNDSLIFDGGSLAADAQGRIVGRAPLFEEDLLIVDFDEAHVSGPLHTWPASDAAAALQALTLGLRDYVNKCGFKKVLLGLSGGVDSALAACLAVKALGKENVWGLGLPSRYSAPESLKDARTLAENLGIPFDVLSIESPFAAYLETLKPVFEERPPDVTEENLQARIRGTLLMALSNKFGHLLLTTGNKSELAVGYCTLYGDMNGGLAVISDVPKTLVYDVAREINREKAVIPEYTITRPPSAELRPDQKDTDSLPDYATLDPILKAYIEDQKDLDQIARETGAAPEMVARIAQMVDRAEYKRRQAPPGLRITSKAFGAGRRLPIAQRYQPPRPGKKK